MAMAHGTFRQGENVLPVSSAVNLDKIKIESARLRIRPIELSDAEDVFREFTPAVATYMTPSPAASIEDTKGFLKYAIEGRKKATDLQLVIECVESGQFFGLIGLHTRFGARTPEIGIWLKSTAQGKGFGREAVVALKEWSDRNLDYDHIVYPVSDLNTASRKIPESLGVIAGEEKVHVERAGREALEILTYAIPRSKAQ